MATLSQRIDAVNSNIQTAKSNLKSAIITKGGTISADNPTFQQLVDGVNTIENKSKITLTNYPLELYGGLEGFTWRNSSASRECNFSNVNSGRTYSPSGGRIVSDSEGNFYQVMGGYDYNQADGKGKYAFIVVKYNSTTKIQTTLGDLYDYGNYSYTSTYAAIMALYKNKLYITPNTGDDTSCKIFDLSTNTVSYFGIGGLFEDDYWDNKRLKWFCQKNNTICTFGHEEYYSGMSGSGHYAYNRFGLLNLDAQTVTKKGYVPIAGQTKFINLASVSYQGIDLSKQYQIVYGCTYFDETKNQIYLANNYLGFILRLNNSNTFSTLKILYDESKPNIRGVSFIFKRNERIYFGTSVYNSSDYSSFKLLSFDLNSSSFEESFVQNVDSLNLNSLSGWQSNGNFISGTYSFNKEKSGILLGNYGHLKLDFEASKMFKVPNLTSQLNKSNTKEENPIPYTAKFTEDTIELNSNIKHLANTEFSYPINDTIVVLASTESKSISGEYILQSNNL